MMIGSNSNITTTAYYQDESPEIELATEIGQALLTEVKRMQAVLQEKQDSLIRLEDERKDSRQRIQDLTSQLRAKDQIEDQLKEEIYQLELTKQKLSHQIRQLSQSVSKAQMEQIRRERQETLIHQELRLLKTAQAKWQEAQTEYESRLTLLNDSIAKLEKEKGMTLSHSDDSEEEEADEPLEFSHPKVTMTAAQITTPANDASSSLRHVTKPYIDTIDPSIVSSSNISSPSTSRIASFAGEHSTLAIEPEEHDFRTMRFSNVSDRPTLSSSERLDLSLPCIIHTMTGEKIYKLSEGHFKWYIASKRQARFFWIHPYTKTLYWSKNEPGLQNNVHKAKSVHIESFSVEFNKSLPVIAIYSTTQTVKIQCTNTESHDMWIQALRYFVLEKNNVVKRKTSYRR